MSERFDDLSRAMARPQSRRGVLKLFGGAAVAAAAATALKPFRADASCPAGTTPCGDACCPSGTACLNASTATCGCPAGTTQCGTNAGQPSCCSGTCANPATNCCCAKGTTACGNTCCAKGVACIDKANGVCGCPAGYTSCGTAANRTCCPAGTACGNINCQPVGNFTGTNRVATTCATSTCAVGSGDTCGNQLDCGNGCICNQNVTNGVPNGQTNCTQPTFCDNQNCQSNSDCPSGQVCQATCCDTPKCFVVCSSTTAAAAPANAGGPRPTSLPPA